MSTYDEKEWGELEFEQALLARLQESRLAQETLSLFYLPRVDSTNDWAKREVAKKNIFAQQSKVFVAEFQTNGKGQHGRSWVSQPRAGLLCSLVLTIPQSVLQGLSLWVGWVVSNVISQYVSDKDVVAIKWPNDIYLNQQKLAGVLIETQWRPSSVMVDVIVGIGVNFTSQEGLVNHASLENKTGAGHPWRVANFFAHLMVSLIQELDQLKLKGFDFFYQEIEKKLLWQQEVVEVSQGDQVFRGVLKGIAKDGALLIEKASLNQRLIIYNGSLRLVSAQTSQ
jgi:BirA family biotin operon repressor/biotin-[acetyl-CoA-carboxylase] ligase